MSSRIEDFSDMKTIEVAQMLVDVSMIAMQHHPVSVSFGELREKEFGIVIWLPGFNFDETGRVKENEG